MADTQKDMLPTTPDDSGTTTNSETTPQQLEKGDNGGVQATGNEAEDQTGYVTGVRLWLVSLALSLSLFVTLLDLSIVSTAVPRITSEFHSLYDVGWYASAYQLASAPTQTMSGKIYTFFNTKRVFLIGLFVFETGSLICGLAQSSTMLIVGRAIAGLGASSVQIGCLAILAGAAPLVKRTMLTGVVLGFGQLGNIMGPLLGGVFTEYATWRWCFYVNLPIGAVVAVFVVFIHIPEQTDKIPWTGLAPGQFSKQLRLVMVDRLDPVGFCLFSGATIELLLALQWGGTDYAWSSSTIIGLLAGSGVTCATWLVWNTHRSREGKGSKRRRKSLTDISSSETKTEEGGPAVAKTINEGKEAFIPISIVSHLTVFGALLSTMCLMSYVILATYFLPIYFQASRDASPVMSAVYMLSGIVSQVFCAVVSSILTSKIGYYTPWALAGMALASIGYGLLSTLSPTTSTGRWIGYQIIMGAGRGMAFQPPYICIQHNVAPANLSVALGLLAFSQNFGGAIFMAIGNTIFNTSLKSQLAAHAPEVNATTVVAAGATGFRKVIPLSSVLGVVQAYSNSVDRVFYLAVSMAVVGAGAAWCMGWGNIRKTIEDGADKKDVKTSLPKQTVKAE